ncbi:type III polyketide synthase [Streptomyces sp. SID14478]|uniref:type III polyketide synthase n=1 Tax=Streptomyces sp. SID14478 TaxID=2706073 RepID=UPI0013D91F00|nr:3-oxoacyl-[acyl-carrier-protein] synthase III C-terminal domain-containing protein [Streptomyces sp. SID14478]NEB77619.1 type III polyketide synthase [Streptomyces sp. SID14478]
MSRGLDQNPPTNDAGPRIASTELVVPAHQYKQDRVTSAFAAGVLADRPESGRVLSKISANAGVGTRNLGLRLEDYPALDGFTGSNQAWLECAIELGEQAVKGALDSAGIAPDEVDVVFSTSVTGLTVPSLEARLAQRVGFREDVKRVPLFGLGCAAGAAGIARLHDYLRAFPRQVGVLLAVELCSLTVQREDRSMAGLVAASLFGDGAAAVVAVGAQHALDASGPEVMSTRSRLYPDSTDVMGWRIGGDGFRIVLSPEVPQVAERELPKDVVGFLADHGLVPAEVERWVCHPGGPKVIEAVERAFTLPPEALAHTRESLRAYGNMSSVSVLDVLRRTLSSPPPAGAVGLMTAMGPGFSSELVLLKW